jgi:hypothetical protein
MFWVTKKNKIPCAAYGRCQVDCKYRVIREHETLYVALSDPAGQYLCPKCAHHQNRWVREASISATAQLEGSKLTRAKRQKLEADVTELRSFFKSDKHLVQEQHGAPSSGTCAWLGSWCDGSTFKPILHCVTRTTQAQLAPLTIVQNRSSVNMQVAMLLTHTSSLHGACDAF